MNRQRVIAPSEDPVCGMTVEVDQARAHGLTLTRAETEFSFCSTGCLIDFRDHPDRYLAGNYIPSMWQPRRRPC